MTRRANGGAERGRWHIAGATACGVALACLAPLVLSAPPSAAGVRHARALSAARRNRDEKKFEYKGVVGVGHKLAATINLNCRDRFNGGGRSVIAHVARRPGDPQSVFSRPYVQSNLSGGSSGGVTAWSPTASVSWGRIGSRLATAIRVTVSANQHRAVHYDV
ncbi:MAG TPA: hypothetical protein VHZ05_06200, partial [Acidimicrobiales bacterium]|nr:hypothetical protein [Acidimicrobiales bacterium]